MKLRQWELWKARPAGFERAHWFVLLSNQERLDSARHHAVNALCCFTLRGKPARTDVRLDAADGLDTASVCDCGFVWVLQKAELTDARGIVSWERMQAIKLRLKETLRL
jgi:mRNA-degrading endonuclease toxin of MazEF toxin-antitoxin module